VEVKQVSADAQVAAEQLASAAVALNRLSQLAKERVIALSLKMAERIVGEAVELSPELLSRIYARTLACVAVCEPEGALEVHPADRASSPVDELASRAGLAVDEETSVGRGGVRVRCGGAVVDAGLPSLLLRLEQALRGVTQEPEEP
jgi:flagellar biosynthesis/type III secretory pathway protein FliH